MYDIIIVFIIIIEVVELNDSIDLLTKKLTEAEDCRAQLIKAR